VEVRKKIHADIERAWGTGELSVRSVDAVEDRLGMRQCVASEDAIRNYCNGIGDVNPIYRSVDYARNSFHGCLIAPPHFITAIAFQSELLKEPIDCITSLLFGGSEVEWFRPIRAGDSFTVISQPGQVTDISKNDTELRFSAAGRTILKNQHDEVVAISTLNLILFADPNSAGGKKAEAKNVRKLTDPRVWSTHEVEVCYQQIEQEEIRGAKPRYWEDVEVGDQLPSTQHFFTSEQAISYFAGIAWFEDWRFRMLESKLGMATVFKMKPDPQTGIPELADPWWHIFDHVAQREGFDRAFCPGKLMEAWLGHLVTNWMGDSGFLKKMKCQFRALLFNGSKVICRGEVLRKYQENGEFLVDLKLTLEDHEGVKSIPEGFATVALPARNEAFLSC